MAATGVAAHALAVLEKRRELVQSFTDRPARTAIARDRPCNP